MYLAALRILFFSSTYAVDTSFYPDIKKDVQRSNNLDNSVSNNMNAILTISFKSDERINNLVQYAYTKCLEVIGDTNWYYSCVNMVLTFTAENWWWFWDRVSPTDDHWICQLHYRRHKDFIDSPEFKVSENQIDYCIWVWQNSMQRNKMPWMAYSKKEKMKSRFIITK